MRFEWFQWCNDYVKINQLVQKLKRTRTCVH